MVSTCAAVCCTWKGNVCPLQRSGKISTFLSVNWNSGLSCRRRRWWTWNNCNPQCKIRRIEKEASAWVDDDDADLQGWIRVSSGCVSEVTALKRSYTLSGRSFESAWASGTTKPVECTAQTAGGTLHHSASLFSPSSFSFCPALPTSHTSALSIQRIQRDTSFLLAGVTGNEVLNRWQSHFEVTQCRFETIIIFPFVSYPPFTQKSATWKVCLSEQNRRHTLMHHLSRLGRRQKTRPVTTKCVSSNWKIFSEAVVVKTIICLGEADVWQFLTA